MRENIKKVLEATSNKIKFSKTTIRPTSGAEDYGKLKMTTLNTESSLNKNSFVFFLEQTQNIQDTGNNI